MSESQSDLEALTQRLEVAALRLKSARQHPGEPDASPKDHPAPEAEGLAAALAGLEAARVAVRDARCRLAALESGSPPG